MKKFIFILTAVILLAVFAGCSSPGIAEEAPAGTSPASAEPTPEPPRVVAVVTDSDAELFAEGVKSIIEKVENTELVITGGGIKKGITEAADAAVVLAYVTEENADMDALAQAALNGAEVYVFDTGANNVPDGVLCFGYDTSSAHQLLMDTLLTLPSHDTPVRLLGMFTSQTTEAASAFAAGCDEGKIFNKGVYCEDENDATPEEWFASMLESYYPGMLDAVYAENERMAQTALEALNAAGRTDVEVVTLFRDIPADEMSKNPYIYYAEICPNTYYIGAYLADTALKGLGGDEAKTFEFTPDVLYASDIEDGFLSERMSELFPF